MYVARNNDHSPVMGAKHEYNIEFDYELRGAFVLASAKNNHTLHGNSPRKETEAGDNSVNIGGGVLSSTWSAGIGQADTSCGNCRVLGAMAGGGVVPPPIATTSPVRPQRWVPPAALRRVLCSLGVLV